MPPMTKIMGFFQGISSFARAQLVGNRLEKLKGDRAGTHSIRVNKWRICLNRDPPMNSAFRDDTIAR